MDPVTQGALGAAAALAAVPNNKLKAPRVALMGALGGMAADLDILIRSSSDSLLNIEYHRHFTHALAFIPVGGLLVALPWLLQRRWRPLAVPILLATTLGYATHGLLDACTTYGTLLLWPFSDYRVSWRLISVIDPAFTIPLLGAVIATAWRGQRRWVSLGLAWCALYLLVGGVQQSRAADAQLRLAQQRGHPITRAAVFPGFANNITWRSVYQSGGRYYVDKIRARWDGTVCATPGVSVPVPTPAELNLEIRGHRLMHWFSSGWVAIDPEDPSVLGDLRYSFSPTEATSIWGVRDNHWVNNRHRRGVGWRHMKELVFADGPDAVCWD